MSDNNQRRKAAMQSLDKEIKSRDRAEKMKPLGVVTAAAVAIVVIVGGIILRRMSGSITGKWSAAAFAAILMHLTVQGAP